MPVPGIRLLGTPSPALTPVCGQSEQPPCRSAECNFSRLDERQITHLICARLKYDLYDFFRGCFGPASFLFLV